MNKGHKGWGRGFFGTARKNQRGQVLVELALCVTIYVMLMLGILDVSRVFLRLHQLSQVAREGARIASITANIDSPAQKVYVQDRMDQILANMGLTAANAPTITITPAAVTTDGTETLLVDINVSQPVGLILGGGSFIPGFAGLVINVMISMPQFVGN